AFGKLAVERSMAIAVRFGHVVCVRHRARSPTSWRTAKPLASFLEIVRRRRPRLLLRRSRAGDAALRGPRAANRFGESLYNGAVPISGPNALLRHLSPTGARPGFDCRLRRQEAHLERPQDPSRRRRLLGVLPIPPGKERLVPRPRPEGHL